MSRRIRMELPPVAKEGWLRPLRKSGEASLAGADGVVRSSHRLSEVERTTPAAPFKGRGHLLDGAATPPWPRRGVPFGCFATFQVHCVFTNPTLLPAEVRRSEVGVSEHVLFILRIITAFIVHRGRDDKPTWSEFR